MSRKDYVAAAAIVRQAGYLDELARCRLAEDLAAMFAADNPRFNRERFYNACGVAA